MRLIKYNKEWGVESKWLNLYQSNKLNVNKSDKNICDWLFIILWVLYLGRSVTITHKKDLSNAF